MTDPKSVHHYLGALLNYGAIPLLQQSRHGLVVNKEAITAMSLVADLCVVEWEDMEQEFLIAYIPSPVLDRMHRDS